MTNKNITLNFGSFELEAELFDSSIAEKFANNLPYTITLQKWGDEVYGTTGIDLGEEKPVPTIPPGGLAYTNNGNYLCVFFGQTPAWPVEYIGQVKGNTWKQLLENSSFSSLSIQASKNSK